MMLAKASPRPLQVMDPTDYQTDSSDFSRLPFSRVQQASANPWCITAARSALNWVCKPSKGSGARLALGID